MDRAHGRGADALVGVSEAEARGLGSLLAAGEERQGPGGLAGRPRAHGPEPGGGEGGLHPAGALAHRDAGTVPAILRAPAAPGEAPRLIGRADAQQAAVGLPVAHAVSADARVVPVRDQHGAVGGDADVRGPEPDALAVIGLAAGGLGAAQEDRALERDARTLDTREVSIDDARSRIAVQDRAVPGGQRGRRALQYGAARRTAAPVLGAGGEHPGIVLVPVGGPGVLPGERVRAPRGAAPEAEVAEVRALRRPHRPAAAVAVVVVVGRVGVAEGVAGDLVLVAEVVREHLQSAAVGAHAQVDAAGPDLPVVRHEARGVGAVVGGAAGVDRAGAQGEAVGPGDHVGARVAGRHVEVAVVPGDHRVQAVVVVEPAPALQHRLALVRDQVAVRVAVAEEVRRAADVHPLADEGDAERGHELLVLGEHGARVRGPVAVRVLEDHDPVAALELEALVPVAPAAVVDRLGHPDPPRAVDVDGGRVVDQGRLGPELHPAALGRDEALRQVLGTRRGVLQRLAGCGGRGDEDQGGGEEDVHAAIVTGGLGHAQGRCRIPSGPRPLPAPDRRAGLAPGPRQPSSAAIASARSATSASRRSSRALRWSSRR